MPRPERQYLQDIVEACAAIQGFVLGFDRERFIVDDLVRSAVAYKLLIIGEAASHLASVRERNPEIAWDEIVGFRVILAHVYFGLTWGRVWKTATESIPRLRDDVRQMIEQGAEQEDR